MTGQYATHLQTSQVTLRNQQECDEQWVRSLKNRTQIEVRIGSFCAGGFSDESIPSLKDSGGPLGVYVNETQTFVQTGIVHWGETSLKPNGLPSVFNSIQFYRPWIQSTIRTMIQCSPGYGLTEDGLNCFPCLLNQTQPETGKYQCTNSL